MNGPEVAENLQAKHSDLHVLFMSGFSDSELLRSQLSEKNRPLLQKPFTSLQLALKVREAIDQRNSAFDSRLPSESP
jgi:FixJ family two-component response regulator